MKTCRSCGSEKPIEEFHRNPGMRDGRLSTCKVCTSEYHRKHYRQNRERIREQQRLRNAADPEPNRIRAKEWAQENRERKNAWQRAWNQDHPDERLAAWNRYLEQPGKREQIAERMALYNARPEIQARKNERAKQWAEENRLKRAESTRRRQALKLATRVEILDPAKIWEQGAGRCHICGLLADPTCWEMDHAVPLSRGGSHTYENVLVSHPRCNRVKKARLVAEMRPAELKRLAG